MILGIDVGGTHTDAVVIHNGKLIRKTKVLTDNAQLLNTLSSAATEVFAGEDPKMLRRIVLSTTISTNAIVQDKIDRVGLVLACGPGLSPDSFHAGRDVRLISGYINHRGIEVSPVDAAEIGRIASAFQHDNIRHAAVVGKFSTRNPKQEKDIKEALGNGFRHISLGHRLSGHLNFPRRVATAYLNAAVWETYNNFVRQVLNFIRTLGIEAPVYILKADGGTFNIADSAEFPVQTILSGPSASIMGVLSMVRSNEDAVVLDIGGTTTDIALLAGGVPLLEPLGVTIGGHRTLIRGMLTKSIGVGGDSVVRVENGALIIGPQREGVAAAFGGPGPTPTDAIVVLGLSAIGDRQKAVDAIGGPAKRLNCSVEEAAKQIFEAMCAQIALHVRQAVEDVNNRPVYTIHEMLADARLTPKVAYLVGGPAGPVSTYIGELLGCAVQVPEHAEAANAVGAALARTTAELTLLADTERKVLTIPEKGLTKPIPANFTLRDVITTGEDLLRQEAVGMGADAADLDLEVIESQSFNMIKQFYTTGKNMRVKMQVKPGLISDIK